MTLTAFVLDSLPPSASRILEVGCGRGALALQLAEAGHDVLAIDPEAPPEAIFQRTTLEELTAPGPFDAVVASRSLHHIHDLERALDRIHELLRPRGRLVVNEHAFERLDEATAKWYLERRREHEHQSPPPTSLAACRAEWERDHAGLHTSDAMLSALERRFDRRVLDWGPYLHEELGEAVSADEERDSIEAGLIRATGFRYVGDRPTGHGLK